jgi:hypothetical protein
MSEQPDVVEAQPQQAPGARSKSRIWRTVVASVLGVLAVALIGVAVVGVWAEATVLRAEPVASLAVDAIEQPEVQTALASYLADEIQDAVDLEARLDERLPVDTLPSRGCWRGHWRRRRSRTPSRS